MSCLTTSNLPWFMDLTFQVPMQYFSLQHRTFILSPVTSTTSVDSHITSHYWRLTYSWRRFMSFTVLHLYSFKQSLLAKELDGKLGVLAKNHGQFLWGLFIFHLRCHFPVLLLNLNTSSVADAQLGNSEGSRLPMSFMGFQDNVFSILTFKKARCSRFHKCCKLWGQKLLKTQDYLQRW